MYISIILNVIYFLQIIPRTSACAYFPQLSDPSVAFSHLTDGFPDCRHSATSDELDGFLAPVKYHATVLLQKHTIMEIPFNSACIRCGICMAVSEKLEQILYYAFQSSVPLQHFDDYLSAQLLKPICDFAFQSYGLKEWNGLRLISQYPFLDNVPNSLEGRWWEVLRDSCHFYLNHFGEGNLVRAWLLESQNVTQLLCRNDGLFRDCMNIDVGVLTLQFPKRFLFPKNYVRINYPCA